MVRFPSALGISGTVCTNNKIIVRNTELSGKSLADVDNSANFTLVRNCAFFPLYGRDEKVVGVLQLYNKKDGEIEKTEVQSIKFYQKLFGVILQNTIEYNEAIDLMLCVRLTSNKLMDQVTAREKVDHVIIY